MRRSAHKSHCPINLSLEVIGDTWSLLIIRDIVFAGKQSFREFLRSDEGIATNILSNRLAGLVSHGILHKESHPSDGRKDAYYLTEKGIALVPILFELADWSLRFDPDAEFGYSPAPNEDKQAVIRKIQKRLRAPTEMHGHAA